VLACFGPFQGFPFFAGEPRAYALSQILFTPSQLVVAIRSYDAARNSDFGLG
jgi:hypothetical protein